MDLIIMLVLAIWLATQLLWSEVWYIDINDNIASNMDDSSLGLGPGLDTAPGLYSQPSADCSAAVMLLFEPSL